MSKPKIPEPIYFHNSQPVLVKLGQICGQDLYVSLQGDVNRREHDYMLITQVLREAMGYPKSEGGESKS